MMQLCLSVFFVLGFTISIPMLINLILSIGYPLQDESSIEQPNSKLVYAGRSGLVAEATSQACLPFSIGLALLGNAWFFGGVTLGMLATPALLIGADLACKAWFAYRFHYYELVAKANPAPQPGLHFPVTAAVSDPGCSGTLLFSPFYK